MQSARIYPWSLLNPVPFSFCYTILHLSTSKDCCENLIWNYLKSLKTAMSHFSERHTKHDFCIFVFWWEHKPGLLIRTHLFFLHTYFWQALGQIYPTCPLTHWEEQTQNAMEWEKGEDSGGWEEKMRSHMTIKVVSSFFFSSSSTNCYLQWLPSC